MSKSVNQLIKSAQAEGLISQASAKVLNVVDIGGDDRPAASNFLPYEFRSDLAGDGSPKTLTGVLSNPTVIVTHVLTDSHILHLFGDDPFFNVLNKFTSGFGNLESISAIQNIDPKNIINILDELNNNLSYLLSYEQ